MEVVVKKVVKVVLLALSLLLTVGGALAYRLDTETVIDSPSEVHGESHHQHGGSAGHLAPTNQGVRLISKTKVILDAEGRVSDVNVFGNYAYLGAFAAPDCQNGGVYVLDISNPAKPQHVSFIRAANDTYVGEGVQVINITTPHYSGDVLIHNNEICGNPTTGVKGGISLVEVTNPRTPKYLAQGVGDFQPAGQYGASIAHTVHSAFAWDAGDKAYVVSVDNEEAFDVDIMDISDPRNPVLIKEYDLNAQFPQIVQADLGRAESFLHDMIVKQINGRFIMLLSYWDGGYVQLDVTDPLNASYIADTDFTNPDPEAKESGYTVKPEGNGHQAEFSLKNDYIVAADEDFSPYSVRAQNTTDGTEFQATQGTNTPQIDADMSLSGQTVFIGRACNTDPVVPPAGAAKIAVVERGVCSFTEKVANVEAAGGYQGVIVFNREGSDACTGLLTMLVDGTIPALFVGRDTGFGFFNTPYNDAECRDDNAQLAPIAIGATGDTVDVKAIFDGWGYVHLYKNGTDKLTELDTYALPEAHDPAYAAGYSDLSVHEVAMSEQRNDLAYFAYYSGGFRVAKITGNGRNTRLEEVGRFIDQGGNNFWGVQVWQKNGKEYVLASDRDYGLYIFEYTGP